MWPDLTLILGGAASGKSAFAEKLCDDSGLARIYIASAEIQDAEMDAKVARHRARRGEGWQLVEAPLDVAGAMAGAPEGHVVLFDCATLWLSNHMAAGHDVEAETARLLDAMQACPARIVTVSNEVGGGIVPENPLARRFRETQGRLNISLAERADRVIQVVAGLPRVLKGTA